ncbi:TrbI/VirB10 family protein [Magnetospirillum sp. UT-4]|uniref:TrbI/VirB10 family protein n=1 Tax=Magnetospirillum sp. UT-4 TaxID=2681467 RepID=UPI001380C75A|nr:TrbI/VirB10 family protein [Magnetospirillum sp. UT-4]CAA7619310.1 putative type IV secretion system protein ptlG homolog [Magnetospirillum sp. UT-4]
MGALCDLALAAGMTLSGACQPSAPAPLPLPPDDPAVWTYKPPEPKVEAPPPPPPMPPVIIRQEVIREVPVPAPLPVVAPPPGPDALELAMRATYQRRTAGAAVLPEIGGTGTADAGPAMPRPPVPPAGPGGGVGAPVAEYEEKSSLSSLPVDNARIITTDRYISGILETGINTQLDGTTGGPVVIQVTRDVFGYHGRNVLVPKGSRLVCAFKSLDKVGSSRAPLRCSRVLLGESRAEIFGIKANVTDVQGGLGVSGDVDNRFAERYGTAFILAGISAAVRAATAGSNSASSSSSSSSSGSTSSFSGGGGALSEGGSELSQRLGEITAATLEQTINLTPILKVAQGTRVQVRPDTDWYIATVE